MHLETVFYPINPYISEKIWGYERWLVSTLPGKESTVKLNSEYSPVSAITGSVYPLLIKIIDANETLSVQVHPDDEYARIHENTSGKTECWYILEAEPGATLISGIKGTYNRNTFANAIKSNSLEPHLYQTPVSNGDFIFIPAGTVHAIQGGLRLLEVQQPSDVTYRLYDWGRGRELHIEKSLDVIKSIASEPIKHFTGAFSCDYFTVEKIEIDGTYPITAEKNGYFTTYVVLSGSGIFSTRTENLSVNAGDTILAAADTNFMVIGKLELFRIQP